MIQIQLEKAPRVSDDPIDHLRACHRRIEDRLSVLERAADYLASNRDEALEAIENSLRFFDTSGAMHTVDEEQSLFPRLRSSVTTDEAAYLNELESQHRRVEAMYDSLTEAVDRLRVDGGVPEISRYREVIGRLASAYREHISSEDRVLMGLGHRRLTLSQLQEIASEMRTRRGVRASNDVPLPNVDRIV